MAYLRDAIASMPHGDHQQHCLVYLDNMLQAKNFHPTAECIIKLVQQAASCRTVNVVDLGQRVKALIDHPHTLHEAFLQLTLTIYQHCLPETDRANRLDALARDMPPGVDCGAASDDIARARCLVKACVVMYASGGVLAAKRTPEQDLRLRTVRFLVAPENFSRLSPGTQNTALLRVQAMVAQTLTDLH